MTRLRLLVPCFVGSVAVSAGCAGSGGPGHDTLPAPTGQDVQANYWVYVGAESADLIHRIRLGPDGAVLEKTTPVGDIPVEMEGPHGLAISPDGRYLYMTTAHGIPDGRLWKFDVGPDTLVAEPILLGQFPATLDVSTDGLFVFVVNFNLHGEMVPSSVSIVFTPEMVEVARVDTCTMPHGSRVHPAGGHHYSACMMDDEIVEIDTRSFEVSRRFSVAAGREGPIRMVAAHDAHAHHDAHADAHAGHGHHDPTCSPTWAQPAPDGSAIYVACNRSDEVLEIGFEDWTLRRRFATGRGPYNIDVSPDNRIMVVTLKQGDGVQFFDLRSGDLLATRPTTTTVTHGVVISPDSRFAFVSVEGVGAEPGKVDIFDLRDFRLVDSVEVGQQAGGITFWRTEPVR